MLTNDRNQRKTTQSDKRTEVFKKSPMSEKKKTFVCLRQVTSLSVRVTLTVPALLPRCVMSFRELYGLLVWNNEGAIHFFLLSKKRGVF